MPEIAPASSSSRARRARASLTPNVASSSSRADRGGPVTERRGQLGPAARCLRVLDHRADQVIADRRGDHAGPEAGGERARLAVPGDDRCGRRGLAPARRIGGVRKRIRAGGSLDQQPHDRLAAALRLARGLRLLGRVPLGRDRRDLVDVGEDRLGERRQFRGRGPLHLGRLRDPPPRDPGADAIRGEQRLQRPPLAQLPAAEVEVDGAPALGVGAGALDVVDETGERRAHARAHPAPEAALQRARVLGHGLADRGDDLVAQRRHDIA